MTAATQGRNTSRRNAERIAHPVAASSTVFAGTLVALLSTNGHAVPAGTEGSGDAVGVAQNTVVGNSSDHVDTWRAHAFHFANSGGADAVTRSDINGTAYLVDDQTVAKSDSAGTRKVAGKIIDVDAAGVWLLVG